MVARFNLILDSGFIIRDIRLMKSSNGGHWIAWPSRSYKDKDGKDKYFDYISFERDRKDSIEKIVREKAEAFLPKSETYITEVPF